MDPWGILYIAILVTVAIVVCLLLMYWYVTTMARVSVLGSLP